MRVNQVMWLEIEIRKEKRWHLYLTLAVLLTWFYKKMNFSNKHIQERLSQIKLKTINHMIT